VSEFSLDEEWNSFLGDAVQTFSYKIVTHLNDKVDLAVRESFLNSLYFLDNLGKIIITNAGSV
jgi:hypothetical protein